MPGEGGGRDWRDESTSKETTRIADDHQRPGERQGRTLPQSLQEEPTLETRDFGLLASGTASEYILLCETTQFVVLRYSSHRKPTPTPTPTAALIQDVCVCSSLRPDSLPVA